MDDDQPSSSSVSSPRSPADMDQDQKAVAGVKSPVGDDDKNPSSKLSPLAAGDGRELDPTSKASPSRGRNSPSGRQSPVAVGSKDDDDSSDCVVTGTSHFDLEPAPAAKPSKKAENFTVVSVKDESQNQANALTSASKTANANANAHAHASNDLPNSPKGAAGEGGHARADASASKNATAPAANDFPGSPKGSAGGDGSASASKHATAPAPNDHAGSPKGATGGGGQAKANASAKIIANAPGNASNRVFGHGTTDPASRIAALENMLRAAQERNSLQAELLTLHKSKIETYQERAAECDEQQLLQEGLILSLQQAAAAEPPPPSKYAKLEESSYQRRLEYLVGQGHPLNDAMDALDATKVDGNCSSQRAEAHLKRVAEETKAEILRKANAQVVDKALGEISDTSALGYVLSASDDVVDIVLKLREVHAKSRAKAMHNAKVALSAAHLVEAPGVKGDAALIRKGYTFLCRVATAVSEDCTRCKDLRDKLEQEARWAKEKEKAAADKAQADVERKQQAASE